jgi:3-methyladenine DNA glycosylase AlkD
MELEPLLKTLEKSGTEQNRKIYRRHGATDPMWGVSWAVLRDLQKKIKQDHALAEKLWRHGNYDARQMALLIADPAKVTEKSAEAWLADDACFGLVGQLASLVGRTPFARRLADAWRKRKTEKEQVAGWMLTAIHGGGADADEDWCAARLVEIEKGIHSAPNKARHQMNYALIALSARSDALRKQALEVAKKIGKVDVDHGETGCVTPDATSYIMKMAARPKPAAKKKKR